MGSSTIRDADRSAIRPAAAALLLAIAAALAGCGHGEVRIGSDPDDRIENWDGDIEGARQRRQRQAQP